MSGSRMVRSTLIAARHASSKNRLSVGYFPFSKWSPIKLMPEFKPFRLSQTILAGIELIHMIFKGQY